MAVLESVDSGIKAVLKSRRFWNQYIFWNQGGCRAAISRLIVESILTPESSTPESLIREALRDAIYKGFAASG